MPELKEKLTSDLGDLDVFIRWQLIFVKDFRPLGEFWNYLNLRVTLKKVERFQTCKKRELEDK